MEKYTPNWINEGASTCVISVSCWLALCSPTLSPSSNSLKVFDVHTFVPKGYLAIFPISLVRKTITVDVEVIDQKHDYNLLLGRSSTYAMMTVVSTVFCIILFPLDGRVIIVDQLSFCTFYYSPLPHGSVPLVGGVTDSFFQYRYWSVEGFLPDGLFSSSVSTSSTISQHSFINSS